MTRVASFVSLKGTVILGNASCKRTNVLNGLRYACVEMLFSSSVVSMLSSYTKNQESSFYIPKTHQSTRFILCFRREPWPRDSSCVSSVRGVFAVSHTRTPACGSRSDGPWGEDKIHLYSLYGHLTRCYSSFCQAFLGVCDVLTAHSYQLHVWDPTSFGPLLYTPSPKLQRALLTFMCAHVFVGPDCDSQCSGEASFLVHVHPFNCA